MLFDELLMWLYRLMALGVALGMAAVALRAADWRAQVFAAIVFIPFFMRALGLK